MAQDSQIVGQSVLEPFDYRGIELTDSQWKRQADQIREFYLRIPNDDLLLGFRQRAGLPAPGSPLGGWYSSDSFHIFGQILGGFARFYAATGDPACREKADFLLTEWARTIEADGFFFYSKKPNAPHYTYEKMVGGLLDMYKYCGNKEALVLLGRITDWAQKNLGRGRPFAFNNFNGDTEWYTLSENLYRAYRVTGERRYRDFAEVWEYGDFWNIFAKKDGDIFACNAGHPSVSRYHAYSHVNALNGAVGAYLAKGEKHYLDALVNAYDSIQKNLCYATGGYGPDEDWIPQGYLVNKLSTSHNSFEAQCGSWAGFKLSKNLIGLTGDARYGDWTERLLYNCIGATIPMTPDGGVEYFSDYNINGGHKRNDGRTWACCAGTRPQAAADYCDLVYFKDARSLYVNVYLPSRMHWNHDGVPVTIEMTTQFPEREKVELHISCGKPVSFALKFRLPGWLAGSAEAQINGRPVPLVTDNRHWGSLEGPWKDGDKVTLTLPMGFWISPFGEGANAPYAILRGPVVLALRQPDGKFVPWSPPSTAKALEEELQPVPGERLTWQTRTSPAVRLRPYYSFKVGERYQVYFQKNLSPIQFYPEWSLAGNGSLHYCNQVGATAQMSFDGTGITWKGYRFDDAGKAEVRIDDKVVATVDQYGPGRNLPFEWKHEWLPAGKHILESHDF